MIEKLLVCIITTVLIIAPISAEEILLTPETVTHYARQNSAMAKNAALDVEIAQYDTKVAVVSFLPTFSANATLTRLNEDPADARPKTSVPPSVSPELTLLMSTLGSGSGPPQNIVNTGVSVTIPLYTGGKNSNGLHAARATYKHKVTSQVRKLDEVEAMALQAFWRLIAAQEALSLFRETRQWFEKLINDQQVMYETGMIIELDLLKSKTALAQARLGELRAENNIAQSKDALHTILNLPQDAVINVDYPQEPNALQSVPAQIESELDTIINAREDIAAFEILIASLQSVQKIYQALYIPTIFGFFNPSLTNNNPYEDNDLKGSWIAGIGLNWMIYDWGKSRQEILKTDAYIEQLRLGQNSLKMQARFEIKAAYRSLNESIEGLQISREAVSNAKRALEIAELQYKEGMITDIVLTEVRKSLTEAQAQAIQSRIQIELGTIAYKLSRGN